METVLSGFGDTKQLCQQCSLMFSKGGLQQLDSSSGFRRSLLNTFPRRSYCRFCYYLWNVGFAGTTNQRPCVCRLSDLFQPRFRSMLPLYAADAAQCGVIFHAQKDELGRWKTLSVRVQTKGGRMLWECFHPLRIVAPADSALAAHTVFRPIEWRDGLTKELATGLRNLIRDCSNSHKHCPRVESRTLPSRVLRIGEQKSTFPRVNLHVTPHDGQKGQYAALSYCWGGPQDVRLKNGNLDNLQREIDCNTLPQTLKDAILLTHALGFAFPWVDALCIIQDNAADKKREIKRMCSIYDNSAFTIAAATASSVKDGFLQPVSFNEKHASCEMSLPLGTVNVVPVHMQHTHKYPINKRGWTFQEALIPHRVLVLGDLEPFLRCRTQDASPISESYIMYSAASRIEPRRVIDRIAPKQEERNTVQGFWPEIVHQYTVGELGFPEYKPLAILGVIDFLSKMLRDKCYFTDAHFHVRSKGVSSHCCLRGE